MSTSATANVTYSLSLSKTEWILKSCGIKGSVIRLFSKYGVNLCHSKIFASTSETVRYVRNSNLKTITCDGITSISSEHETTEEDAQNNPENEERINAENVPESRIEYTRAADDDDSSFVEPELDEKAHF